MLPPEGPITLICAILIGLVTGAISTQCKTLFSSLGVYLIAFFLALILGASVEAHAAGKHVFYDFGDNLLHHLAVAILGVSLVHLAILGAAHLISNGAFQGTTRTYIPHSLGLLNLFAPVGCVAQLIYWGLNRDDQVASDEAKEALQFQALFVVVFYLGNVLASAIGGSIGVLIATMLIPIFLAWLVQTVVAIIKSKRNGFYSYPLSVRLLRRSQLVTPVA